MNDPSVALVLGSRSARRAEILTTLGIAFEVVPSRIDESMHEAADDAEFVRTLSSAKLDDVMDQLDAGARYVLCADTIVCVDGKRLGQPLDHQDALEMLRSLQGCDHLVRTGVSLGKTGEGTLGTIDVATRVWFRELDDEALRRYIASGESSDKAGAYAVQGLGSGFVSRLEGSYTNVVGLPASEVVELLVAHGAIPHWPVTRGSS